jgi:four helix bundle protein
LKDVDVYGSGMNRETVAINKFEDLDAWRVSRILAVRTYFHLAGCRDYGFKDQAQKAVISIMNNLAEGFDRKSNREFVRFVKIAKGSCAEVRSMLCIGSDLGYFSQVAEDELRVLVGRVGRMLCGLLRVLEDSKYQVRGTKYD